MTARMYNGINLDKLSLIGLDDEDMGCLCQWFHACVHDAVGYRRHPILGDVPICAECARSIMILDQESAHQCSAQS